MSDEQKPVRRRSRQRRLLQIAFGTAAILVVCVAVLCVVLSSPGFERRVQQYLVTALADATGGRVELAGFRWNPWRLEVELRGLTIHGTEPEGEAPYLHLDHGVLVLRILSLIHPRAGVSSLLLERPSIHLIVNPDGSTNQPTPRHHAEKGNSLDTIFDLEAGRVDLTDGEILVNQHRRNFNFAANDVSLNVAYQPAPRNQESYRISLGLANLSMQNHEHTPVKSRLAAVATLHRDRLDLDQFDLTTGGRKLTVSGQFVHFADPSWKIDADGEADIREIENLIQETGVRGGLATIHAQAAGQGAAFKGQAQVKVADATYSRAGAHVFHAALAAHLDINEHDLYINGIEVRLHEGGIVRGEVFIHRYDMNALEDVRVHPNDKPIVRSAWVKGYVDGVSLQQTMEITGGEAYRDLGFRSLIYGNALVEWTRDATDLTVKGDLQLHAPATGAGVPLDGAIQGLYTDLPGRVDVVKMDLHTPASEFHAAGPLGVYPTNQRSAIDVSLTTHDLNEFDTLLGLAEGYSDDKAGTARPPIALRGTAQFNGKMNGSLDEPGLNGRLEAQDVTIPVPASLTAKSGQAIPLHWDHILMRGEVAEDHLHLDEGLLTDGKSKLTLQGTIDAERVAHRAPKFDEHAKINASFALANFDRQRLAQLFGLPGANTGLVQAQGKAQGQLGQLNGSFALSLPGGSLMGEPIQKAAAEGNIRGTTLDLHSLSINQKAAGVRAVGSYDWRSHHYKGHAELNKIDLAAISAWSSQSGHFTGVLSATADGEGTREHPQATIHAQIENASANHLVLGSPDAQINFNGNSVSYRIAAQYNSTHTGADGKQQTLPTHYAIEGTTQLDADRSTHAKADFSQLELEPLIGSDQLQSNAAALWASGSVSLAGPLTRPQAMSGEAKLDQLAGDAEGVHLKNDGPIAASLHDGLLRMQEAHITGEGTDMRVGGSVSITGETRLALDAGGSLNLKLLETFDRDVTSSGLVSFKVRVNGTAKTPALSGQAEFKNGAIALQDLPNGLSQMNGVLEFSDGRLVVKSLTAMTGGGQLKVGGSLTYHNGLYADLTATGNNVRIRYPQGVSSLANANLRLQGSQGNLLLSGNVLVTRFSINPDMDVASLAGVSTSAATIASSNAPSNHIRLDVHVSSAPQLNFQNSYAKLAGDIDLRVRGTLASPSVLGKVSVTEGSATYNGTRYELQHGDIYFTNPVRIEPVIDLTATARVQAYDISIVVHGTPERMNVSYRSEPALSQADVFALLAMGRSQDEQRLNQQQVVQSQNPTTDALLGSALNATLSSRARKLFGTATVKIDPTVVSTQGNTSARVTVDQPVGKNVVITYATNVNTTAQQFIQAEIQLNHGLSLVAVRDETGVASMVLRLRKRYH